MRDCQVHRFKSWCGVILVSECVVMPSVTRVKCMMKVKGPVDYVKGIYKLFVVYFVLFKKKRNTNKILK